MRTKKQVNTSEGVFTTKLNSDMLEIIEHHLPDRSRDTISCYEMWNHETYYEYNKEGKIDWMVSYFFLDFKWDMVIVMQRDNNFTKQLWKILKDTIKNRIKPLRISSDPTNKVLVRGAIKNGGIWHDDEIWFN